MPASFRGSPKSRLIFLGRSKGMTSQAISKELLPVPSLLSYPYRMAPPFHQTGGGRSFFCVRTLTDLLIPSFRLNCGSSFLLLSIRLKTIYLLGTVLCRAG